MSIFFLFISIPLLLQHPIFSNLESWQTGTLSLWQWRGRQRRDCFMRRLVEYVFSVIRLGDVKFLHCWTMLVTCNMSNNTLNKLSLIVLWVQGLTSWTMSIKLGCNEKLKFVFLFCAEPWAANHEEVGPLQHSPPALLLLLQWRQGQSAEGVWGLTQGCLNNCVKATL